MQLVWCAFASFRFEVVKQQMIFIKFRHACSSGGHLEGHFGGLEGIWSASGYLLDPQTGQRPARGAKIINKRYVYGVCVVDTFILQIDKQTNDNL